MSAPFTPEQEARLNAVVREALIVHSIGAASQGDIARRHFTLFYGEVDARQAELAALDAHARDLQLREIGREAHHQELAERQAAERASDPDHLTAIERIGRDVVGGLR